MRTILGKGLEATATQPGLIAAPAQHRGSLGSLAGASDHCRKVARSFWAGLFLSHEVEVLPRTSNDPEQHFGSYRYHERRAGGRKVAFPSTVVRGPVRLVAATATRLRTAGGSDLIPADVEAWRRLRGSSERRQAMRRSGVVSAAIPGATRDRLKGLPAIA